MLSEQPRNVTRILLVEDDHADAVLFERILSKCAGTYQVQIHSTLADAMQWLATNSCDVMLLDFSLPDSFGLDSIREIHNLHADLPIVMLTGLDDDKTALDALDCGAQDYLVKGVANPRELERTLRHAIQRQNIQNENRRLVIELEIAAKSDALTGVLNRHAMMAEFVRRWSSSRSADNRLSCVILDVDYFKKINDRFGHLAGDEVLKAVAQVVKDSTRPGDCIARYGGEEFCVILVEATEEEAVAWADRARQRLANCRFHLSDQVVTVTASFGAAQRTTKMESITDLIDAADQALWAAKTAGRNRVSGASNLSGLSREVVAPLLPSTLEPMHVQL